MTSDSTPPPTPADHGEVVPRRRFRISPVWIFPLMALFACGWLMWSQWRERGPEITIAFDSAPGIQANRTMLFYRGVKAGEVMGVELSPNLEQVNVRVRLRAFAADLSKEGTQFWIDQPVISLEQTTGLEALIQGNSLQARMGTGPHQSHFVGLKNIPVTPLDASSLVIRLRAELIPFLGREAPLFHRGVEVGKVEDKYLDADGLAYLRVIVEDSYANRVRQNSRFWILPATSLEAGPGGVRLDVAGLNALVRGGIAFDTFETPAAEALDEMEFTLSPNERSARASSPPLWVSFEDGRGLLAGQTPVTYLGLAVGIVETAAPNPQTGRVEARLRLEPEFALLRTEGTRFTLVRPQFNLKGVTGLETLISGSYLAAEPGTLGTTATHFVGRSLSDEEWNRSRPVGMRQVTLIAKGASPAVVDTPVMYRGLNVGRVVARELTKENHPRLTLEIRSEYANTLQASTRFWQIPATAVQAGPGVINVEVANFQSLLRGGIAYDSVGGEGKPTPVPDEFELYATESLAKANSEPIQISFGNGQGLLAGQTQLRYLGVPVGLVTEVKPLNGEVLVTAQLEPGYEHLRRRGSHFAVVRPRLSLEGVTGLEALVSGIYIECVPSSGGELAQRFKGESVLQIEPPEKAGNLEIILDAPATRIAMGAPVYYRGLPVGKVARKGLSAQGRSVELMVEIEAPYASLVRENSKFWDVSGIHASIGFLSLKVQAGSLESMAIGGMAFATPSNTLMGPPARKGTRFELHANPRREWLRWDPAIPLKKSK